MPKKNKRKCFARETCIDYRKKYGHQVFPVCPILQEMVNKRKPCTVSNVPKTSWRDLDSIRKILAVCSSLINFEPNLEATVWCAHSKNFLEDCIDLIRTDLSSLPKMLEKDFPDTAKKCIELVAELELAELRYDMYRCSRGWVYLLPPKFAYADWPSYLGWRKEQIHLANLQGGLSKAIEMNRFTCTYPAEGIQTMHKICKELTPLAHIFPEEPPDIDYLETKIGFLGELGPEEAGE